MKLLLCSLALAGLGTLLGSANPSRPSSAAPGAETFAIDTDHSTVLFRTTHLGLSQAWGRFNKFGEASKIVFDAADPAKSSVLLVVAAESVDTAAPDRDKHLRSADFFNSKEFPEIVFQSKTVGGKPEALTIEGELTFRGVTKPVKAKAKVVGQGDTPFGDHRAGFVAELTLDMNDYGVPFTKKSPTAVGPEVSLTISIEGVRQ